MKLRRRWQVLIALVLAASMLVGGCVVASRDEPPPDDSDLLQELAPVPEAENGWRHFRDAPDFEPKIGETEDGEEIFCEGQPFGDDWNPDAARKLLAVNAELLRRYDAASDAPSWRLPEPAWLSREWQRARDLAVLVPQRGGLKFESGDELGALKEARRLVDVGRRLQASHGGELAWLVGLRIESAGLSLLRRLIWKTGLPDEPVARLTTGLQAWTARDACLTSMHRQTYADYARICTSDDERAGWPALLAELQVSSWSNNRFLRPVIFKPQQTRRMLAEHFRVLLDWQAPWLEPAAPLGYRRPFPAALPTSWAPTNAVGKEWIEILAKYRSDQTLHALASIRAVSATPELSFALRRHQRDRGALPERLEDLVPAYLDRVPMDPCDGKPMKYSREKRSVHSVGPLGENAAGDDEDWTWKVDQ